MLHTCWPSLLVLDMAQQDCAALMSASLSAQSSKHGRTALAATCAVIVEYALPCCVPVPQELIDTKKSIEQELAAAKLAVADVSTERDALRVQLDQHKQVGVDMCARERVAAG